jgi:hypothetical protein
MSNSNSSYEESMDELHPNASIEVTRDTTFEEWYASWKAASSLRQGPGHPVIIHSMRQAWEAGKKVGLDINY